MRINEFRRVGYPSHLRESRFRIGLGWSARRSSVREFVRLMLPRMASYPIDPILLTFFGVLALSFGTGRASALAFADDYRVVPVILIAQQFSLAVFPSLAAAHAGAEVVSRYFRDEVLRQAEVQHVAG